MFPLPAMTRARFRDPRVLPSRTRQDVDSGPWWPSRALCTRRPVAFPEAPAPCAAPSRGGESCEGRCRRATRPHRRDAASRPAAEAMSSFQNRSDRGYRPAHRAGSARLLSVSYQPSRAAIRKRNPVGSEARLTVHRAPDPRLRIRYAWHVPMHAHEGALRKPHRP